jgi:tRNA pseudouridine55 synthase
MMKIRCEAAKAGHLGTLDPLATGVFPVCLGKATRLTPFYMGADKCYLTAIKFGYFTSTDDREGDREGPVRKITFSSDQLKSVIATFQGDYDQKPPIYSAKKIHGQPAYRLARRGAKPEIPIQKVKIHEISMTHFERDTATVYIHCSSGTYVRSIARDLGAKMRSGAHVHELTRTKFGQFNLNQTCLPDAKMEALQASFIPVEEMLSHFPQLVIDDQLGKKLSTGSAIQVDRSFDQEWVRVFNQDHALLALAQVLPGDTSQKLQPKIVFA